MANKAFSSHLAGFGEVVETGIDNLVVQYWPSNTASNPAYFGELVKLQAPWGTAFGLIYNIYNQSIFSQGRPLALQLTAQELALQQPQLADVIADFAMVKIFAYQLKDTQAPIFNCAPQPIKLHTFVQAIELNELKLLLKQPLFFLHALQSIAKTTDINQISLAMLTKIAQQIALNAEFFSQFYRQYSRLPNFNQTQARVLFSQLQQLQSSI